MLPCWPQEAKAALSGKRILQRSGALAVGLVLAALAAELALRIHNPIPLRLRGKDIVLPANTVTVVHNLDSTRLGDDILVTRNSFGFRGPEPPADFERALSIVTVGGSTTEDRFLSDGETWTDLLGARLADSFTDTWVNNAGLDGHSTFGHLHLLDQVLLDLAPDYLVFLVGINDVDRDDANHYDLKVRPGDEPLGQRIVRNSELLSTLLVIRRSLRALDLGVGHIAEMHLEKCPVGRDDPAQQAELERRQRELCLPRYHERLELLIDLARDGGIEPVLVTQPALFGDALDPTTGLAIGERMHEGRSASLHGRILESFNDVTRDVGRRRSVLVIELARELPKDTSVFYDWMHFSNRGAEAAAEIIARQLIPFLAQRHPDRLRGQR